MQKNCSADLDYSKTKANRAVLTDEDTDEDTEIFKVCAQQDDCLAAVHAQVILLVIGCATGFRACGTIHQT